MMIAIQVNAMVKIFGSTTNEAIAKTPTEAPITKI